MSTTEIRSNPNGNVCRIIVASAIGLLALLLFPRAAAAVPSARFVYLHGKGTETCPTDEEVRAAVETRLGYNPFSTYADSTMFTEVTTDPQNGGFSARLKLVDRENVVTGDRELHVRGKCSELMDAMALTISIAIDPMSITRQGRPADAPPLEKDVDPSSSSASPPNPNETSTASDQSPPSPIEGKKTKLFVSLGPLASAGSAPAISFGGALAVDAELGRLLAALEARADLPASASARDGLGRVSSSLIAGTLALGIREGLFFASVVGMMGRIAATSSDVARSNDVNAIWISTGFRVGVSVPITEVIDLRGRVEVLANLQRHALEISGQTAYQYPIASGDLGIAVAARFR